MTKKNLRQFAALAFFMVLASSAPAQDSSKTRYRSLFGSGYLRIDPGIGLGLDYGGIGFKAEFVLTEWLGVFGGFGYNFITPAYNTGISIKLMPQKKQPL